MRGLGLAGMGSGGMGPENGRAAEKSSRARNLRYSQLIRTLQTEKTLLQWLHSLLPHVPHYGWMVVFLVELLNNCGVPLPGDSILLGAGFILGKNAFSMWEPMAAGTAGCFLGGLWAFWLGGKLGHSGFKKIHWLHFTPERVKWMENFYKRLGPRAVFIARFIFLLPPIAANLMAGMAKMKERTFIFYNLAGSAVYSTSFIFIGFFFGKKWESLKAWMGPTALYLIVSGVVLITLVVACKGFAPDLFSGSDLKKRKPA